MTAKEAEQVLVAPTRLLREAGLFQGFSERTAHYLPLTQTGVTPLEEFCRHRAEFETWSQFVLDVLRIIRS